MLSNISNNHDVVTINLTHNRKVNGVVYICHGMSEHVRRYHWFTEQLNKDGFHVVAIDHRGHGRWIENGFQEGVFAQKNGWDLITNDLLNLISSTNADYPNIDHYLFSHSMGSFIALSAIQKELRLSGLILSASTKTSSLLSTIQILVIKIITLINGRASKSKFFDSLTMRTFNNKFSPSRTRNDWISTDPKNVDDYTNDPLCGFIASNGVWLDMVNSFKTIFNKKMYPSSNLNIPILIISGDEDPVGENGKGVARLYKFLKNIFYNVEYILLKNERHEILSGISKQLSYNSIKEFLLKNQF